MPEMSIFILVVSIISFLVGLTLRNLLFTMNGMLSNNWIDEADYQSLKVYKNHFLLGAVLLPLFYFGYSVIEQNGFGSHVMEWINLVVRWAHVVLGISWIGASFYFIFLENSLNRTKNLRDELAGDLWAIHGGGFYYVEKYKNAPRTLPEKLHWFKFEAYYTWITGMLLLILVYYLNAKSFMIDPSVRNIDSSTAICISIATIISGWIIYDFLCKTPLLHQKKAFAAVGFFIITMFAFFLSKVFSGRAAFMHVGALIGTIMAGNVFFTIIPSQKALVKAARENIPVNPDLGKYAGLRSLHNNYLTLPVIFIMISNHFPVTFGNAYNWAVLAGLTLTSVAVRHFINLYEKGKYEIWILPFAVTGLVALIIVTAPSKVSIKDSAPVSFSQVQPIILKRCVPCHSSNPTDDVQKIAPNGILFDTPEQIKSQKERILIRAVQTKTMPQANKTGITEEERALIGSWIAQGGKIN
jgi:uncharacterized membrane protein